VDELAALPKDGFILQLGEFGTMRLPLLREEAKTTETFLKKALSDISFGKGNK